MHLRPHRHARLGEPKVDRLDDGSVASFSGVFEHVLGGRYAIGELAEATSGLALGCR
jgi:hypothetical protein